MIQLRALVPLGDPRSESVGESALRLHWHEAGLPRPELQHWVYSDEGLAIYRLDLALPELRYGAEYDGEQFHSSRDDREHDAERRLWLANERDWKIDPFTKVEVYGRHESPVPQLQAGFVQARRRVQLWTPHRRD